MEPINPGNSNPTLNPISPQPLNTGEAAKPADMPLGSTVPPAGGVSGGLPPQMPTTGSVKSGGSKKVLMTVVIIVLIIAILGVGGYLFYSMQNNSSPADNSVVVQDDPDLVQLQTETSELELGNPQEEITQISSEINMLEATPAASASSSVRPR